MDNGEKKFRSFFEKDIRRPNLNDNQIDTEFLKESLNNLFKMCKTQLFENLNSITEHPFSKVLVPNWESSNPNLGTLALSANANNQNGADIGSTVKGVPCDGIFFQYLKEMSSKTNKEYFWFILKFIFLFRECINKFKKAQVNEENSTNDKCEYTQIYNAEAVPDQCNDFVAEFMDPNDFFGLDTNELIEIIQHLCFWLYSNNYTTSRLTLL